MKNKKGFTVVELVIVIAIIAVLAAVLIPTFSAIIKKANVSKDQQLIRNLNTALESDQQEHPTMTDALRAAADFGYDVGKINKSATDNEILWDAKNDLFCYLDNSVSGSTIDKIQYIPESVLVFEKNNSSEYKDDKVNLVDYWVISKTINEDGFSTYLYGYEGLSEVTIGAGLDVGTESVTKINYISNVKKTVTIRTNGGILYINAELDTVKHYGYVGYLDIEAIGTESYHEFGLCDSAQIKKGRIVNEVYEEGVAGIQFLFLIANEEGSGTTAGSFLKIIIEAAKGAKIPTLERTHVVIGSGVKVCEIRTEDGDYAVWLTSDGVFDHVVLTDKDASTPEGGTVATLGTAFGKAAQELANDLNKANGGKISIAQALAGNSEFAAGVGSETFPYLISNATQLANVKNHLNASYKVINDIDMTGVTSWTEIGTSDAPFSGKIDGGGFAIINWTTDKSLFGIVKGTKNTALDGTKAAALDDNYNLVEANVGESNYGCVIKNLNFINDVINLTDNMGAFANVIVDAYTDNLTVSETTVNYLSGDYTGTFFGEVLRSHIKGLTLGSLADNSTLANDVTVNITTNGLYGNVGLLIGTIGGKSSRLIVGNGDKDTGTDIMKNTHYQTIVDNCKNYTNATVYTQGLYFGGVVGAVYTYDTNEIIIDCINKGSLELVYKGTGEKDNLSGVSVSGICGVHLGSNYLNLIRCYNSGNISLDNNYSSQSINTAQHQISGICSYAYGPFIQCRNEGSLSGPVKYIGGICSFVSNQIEGLPDVIFDSCISTGTNSNGTFMSAIGNVYSEITAKVYENNPDILAGINASAFIWYKNGVETALIKPTGTYTYSESLPIGLVDLSEMSENADAKITLNVNNCDVVLTTGTFTRVSIIINGTNNKLTIPAGLTMNNVTLNGDGNYFENYGTIAQVEYQGLFAEANVKQSINHIGASIQCVHFACNDGSYVRFKNEGTIDATYMNYDTQNNPHINYSMMHAVSMPRAINLVFDNYGTIVSGHGGYCININNNVEFVLNTYKNGILVDTGNGSTKININYVPCTLNFNIYGDVPRSSAEAGTNIANKYYNVTNVSGAYSSTVNYID